MDSNSIPASKSPFYYPFPVCVTPNGAQFNFDPSAQPDAKRPLFLIPSQPNSTSENSTHKENPNTNSKHPQHPWFFMDPYSSPDGRVPYAYPMYAYPPQHPGIQYPIMQQSGMQSGMQHPAIMQMNMMQQPMQYSGVPIKSEFSHRVKRNQVKVACIHCKKACKKCDEARPCGRCIRMGTFETCVSAARKPRPVGLKRGPYRKEEKEKSPAPVSSSSVSPDASFELKFAAQKPISETSIPFITPSTSPTHDKEPSGLDMLSLICDRAKVKASIDAYDDDNH